MVAISTEPHWKLPVMNLTLSNMAGTSYFPICSQLKTITSCFVLYVLPFYSYFVPKVPKFIAIWIQGAVIPTVRAAPKVAHPDVIASVGQDVAFGEHDNTP